MHPRRRVRRLLLGMGLVAAFVVGSAAPAFAHAVLLSTTPAGSQILLKPPTDITLRFNENVEASLGAVRLYDTTGKRIDTGATTKTSADVVQVPIRSKLPNGAYVVTWRVISADSHPVQGSFTFQVGTAANATAPQVQALAGNLLSKEGGSRVVGVIYGVARWFVFTALALFIGVAAFLVLVWPRGTSSRRARVLVWSGWGALFAGTLISLLLEGPYGGGLGLGEIFKSSVISDVLHTHFGHVTVARLVLLALTAPMLVVWFRHRDNESPPAARPWWRLAAAVLAASILLTFGLAGHADVGNFVPIALVADWIHLAAMSVWIGGLIILVAAVLASSRSFDEQREIIPRFSRIAFYCVGALIASGAYQTWRQVGGLEAFKRTDFGQLLVIKLAGFAVLIIVASRSRQITNYVFRRPVIDPPTVPVISGAADDSMPGGGVGTQIPVAEPSDGGDDDYDDIDEEFERRSLRRAVSFEVFLALVILAVSALLVNAQPGRTALEDARLRPGLDRRDAQVRQDLGGRHARARFDGEQRRTREHAGCVRWPHDAARSQAHPRPPVQGHRAARRPAHQGGSGSLLVDRSGDPVGRAVAHHGPCPPHPDRRRDAGGHDHDQMTVTVPGGSPFRRSPLGG